MLSTQMRTTGDTSAHWPILLSYTSLKSGAFNARMVDCNVNLHGQAHAVRKKRGVVASAQTLKSSVWLWRLYHSDTKRLVAADLQLGLLFFIVCFLLIYCCFAVLSYCSCTFWSWFKLVCWFCFRLAVIEFQTLLEINITLKELIKPSAFPRMLCHLNH